MQYRSMGQVFYERVQRLGEREAYRYKQDDQWISVDWTGFGRQVRNLALALLETGLTKGDRVCVLCNTRREWELSDKAITLFGGITVGIYQTLPSSQIEYHVAHSEAKAIVIEDSAQFHKVLEVLERCPTLQTLIVIDPEGCQGTGFHRFYEMLDGSDEREQRLGARLDELAASVEPSDPVTFIYTSGTTGPPKGAIITHYNLMSEGEWLAVENKVTPDDLTLTWLPFAHIFQRATTAAGTWGGAATAFAESIDKLIANLGEVRPTIFYSVPRIYEKAYAKITENAESGGAAKAAIFHWSMGVGRKVSRLKQHGKPVPALLGAQYALARRLVFDKIKMLFGGRIRMVASSAAPISPEILEFFHAADILTLEAYGATELTAAITFNRVDDYRFGTVGKPGGGIKIKIAHDGEIMVHGPMVFQGYFKEPQMTAEVLDDQGWYATGGVGEIDADGFLKITDRKKDIIVTSGGKNVAPQNIEGLIKQSVYISQAMVHGDRRNYLTCLLTLDEEHVKSWAASEGLPIDDWELLCSHAQLGELIQSEVDRANAQLAKFETIKKFRIIPIDFSVESGELTPTLKVKRKVVTDKYKHLLDEMYL
ncbi:MAG: long-chain fatty acid--CoA ligase [Candidatus Alcyoniella australis]|nr:long-chain fatty acid--CoA ligase [Candidatus Alcyoniella australis]